MATTYLTRTVGTPTNIDKYTFSVWIKRADIGAANSKIFSVSSGSAYGEEKLEFNADDLKFNLTDTSGNDLWSYTTNRKFRDCSGYYHIVLAVDTTLGTAADRVKLYVNGVQETSFSSSTNSPQNQDSYINKSGSTLYIGRLHSSSDQFFGGVMSHIHFIDGTQYAASDFGSFDTVTGEWNINTAPNVTYGNNGFFWLKDDVATTDHSPNSNTLTVAGGTLTKTEDNPSNTFCSWNTMQPHKYTFSSSNTKMVGHTSSTTAVGTICPNKGKWYWEVKLVSGQSSYPRIGIFRHDGGSNHVQTTHLCGGGDGSGRAWGSNSDASIARYFDGDNSYVTGASYANGDILQFAMDLDNGKVWFGKNNTWYGSGSSTVAIADIADNTATPTFSNLGTGVEWTPACFGNQSADIWAANFGTGYFGTTQVSSAGTNASNIGIFEHDVPNNFTALCTKGLNE